ncbi:alpha/beta fold hydrolase [Falsiroseomonas stagni]|uniref:Pimeloyl-ACP methyl ester carboxylesterase n=1 Tax=Falsiroseomonas stagni DSM 19981 TaxID=1123062 RepID=A0A1I4AUV6_9PROT|nr:alpha/beta hydrolase [Falsiroseomonas stagni]SFK60322.1 Pimeloyl-ACP methyl ester carboxylesterase [Falsiroseomonas stagni DSM 19981]
MLSTKASASFLPGEDFAGVGLRPPLDPSYAMRRMTLPTGVTMAFTYRPGAGLPILFLTANRTTRRIFDFVLAELDLPNPVLVPDYRGLGESDAPAGSLFRLEEHREDLVALTRALGWKRFAVVGQATGATLALLLATRLPEGVVAVAAGDPAIGLRDDVFALFLDQVERHDRGFATRAEALAETPFREAWTDAVAEHWLDTALMDCPDGRLRWRYDVAGITETQRALTADFWRDIDVAQPTLLFGGEHCTVIGPAAMARAREAIPQARLEVLAGANHRLTQDNPAGFAALVRGFLARECASVAF